MSDFEKDFIESDFKYIAVAHITGAGTQYLFTNNKKRGIKFLNEIVDEYKHTQVRVILDDKSNYIDPILEKSWEPGIGYWSVYKR